MLSGILKGADALIAERARRARVFFSRTDRTTAPHTQGTEEYHYKSALIGMSGRDIALALALAGSAEPLAELLGLTGGREA